MPVVRGTITDDAGNPLERVRVIFTLVSSTPTTPVYADGGGVAVIAEWVLTDEAGEFSIDLLANSELVPEGTYYRVDVGRKRLTIVVPSSAGPHDIDDLLVDTPGEVEAAPLSAHLQDETAHAAEHITFEPTGPLQSTNAQDAIVEAATEAAAGNHNHDATYVNEADHTLAAHDAMGLATDDELADEASTRAAADLAEATARDNADDAEALARANADTAHTNDTTNVHGIADTANLETQAGSQAKVDAETAARIAADALLIPLTQKGAANGVATLGADSKIPGSQIPSLAIGETSVVASEAAMLALTAQRGDVAIRTDLDPDGVFILTTDSPTTLADWIQITAPGAVVSVNGETGAVSLSPADVGAQASDADLTAIAGLDSSTAGAIASDGAGWIKKTYAQFKTALGISDDPAAGTPGLRTLGAGAQQAAAGNHNHDGTYSALGHNHDGAYSALGHLHDDRYFTEAESDGRFGRLGTANIWTQDQTLRKNVNASTFTILENTHAGADARTDFASYGRTSAGNAAAAFKYGLTYFGFGNPTVIDGQPLADATVLDADTALWLYARANRPIHFYTNAQEKMRVDGADLAAGQTALFLRHDVAGAEIVRRVTVEVVTGYLKVALV